MSVLIANYVTQCNFVGNRSSAIRIYLKYCQQINKGTKPLFSDFLESASKFSNWLKWNCL